MCMTASLRPYERSPTTRAGLALPWVSAYKGRDETQGLCSTLGSVPQALPDMRAEMGLSYFPLYADDFEADTAHLTLAEDGAYNRLLRLCWRTPGCKIPAEREWIYRRMRANTETEKKVVDTVLDEFFTVHDGCCSNARLTKEWLTANEAHERRKRAGAKGGLAKGRKSNNKAPSNAKAMHKQPEPEPYNDTKVSLPKDNGFEAFWAEVPRKIGKGAARKAYASALRKTDAETLLEAMRRFAASQAGKDAQFIPHPSTWLNAERWTDEDRPALRVVNGNEVASAAEFWAGKINSGAHVPTTAISGSVLSEIQARGLVPPETLKAKGLV